MDNDKHAVSKEFPELFHYTNLSAFKNIYESRKFRATHYEDLNDSTEFIRFRLKVLEFIRPMIWGIFNERIQCDDEVAKDISEQGGIDAVVDKEAEWSLERVHSHTFNKNMYKETFICSFCAHKQSYESTHGLLSQWRGYGADGGVAIVLATYNIQEMMQREYDVFQYQIMYMGDVIYDTIDNNMRIKSDFRDVFEYYPKALKALYSVEELYNKKKLALCFKEMHNHFVLGSTLVKHQAFREENEIRIVASPMTNDSYSYYPDPKRPKEILYKQLNNREACYIELFGEARLPIKRIIVGPSRIQNVNYQTTKDIAKNQGIEVVKSEIPFNS